MAVAVSYEFSTMTREQYDRLMAEVFRNHLAPGVLSHVAGPLEQGWWATDVYASEEVAEQFGRELVPGLQAFGVDETPRMTIRQVHNVLPG